MAVDMFGNELDASGNLKPKKGQPGYVDPTVPTQRQNDPSQTVALSPAALSGSANYDTNAGNTAVLAQAQQNVLNQPGVSDLQKATTESATNWVKNPLGNYDPEAAKRASLDRANADWAKSFEAQRQNFGNVSGSGLLQQNMLANALSHNVDQATLAAQMDKQNSDMYQQALGASIGAGQSVNQGNENIFSQRLGNAATVRGMAEGERAQGTAFSQDLYKMATAHGYDLDKLDKTFGHEDATLLATQGWQSGEKALDRMAAVALQKGDIEGQKEIQKLRNEWSTNERIATQSWQTGERLGSEDAAKAAQYFDAKQKILLQSNDIEGQKVLATLKNGFDLNMKTMDMDHDVKMAYLNNQFIEAKANNDVTRQKDILSYQYNQEISKMAVEQGYDVAKMQVQAKIQEALNKGDYEHAEAMQKSLFDQQSKENAKDRLIQNAQVALQAKGINLQELEQQYSQLEKLVKAGTLDKSVLNDFVSNNMKGTGITLKEPDPLEAQKEADKEFAALQTEYLRTHPEMKDPVTGKLNAEGIKDFNNFVNKSMYGEVTTGAEATSQKAQAAIEDPVKYQELLKDPTVKDWTPQMSYDTGGMFGADKRKFVNAPTKGTIIKYGGKAYEVLSDTKMDTKGEDSDYFTVRDLKDGTTRRISIVGKATFGSKPSVTGF